VTGYCFSVWDEAACKRVHEATLEVLAETGVDVLHEEARELLASAGARIEGVRVRIDRGLVDEALASAPRAFVLNSRGGNTPLTIRDGECYFGTGSDCLYHRDLDTGERRRVRNADIEGMAALCERLPNIDFVMSMGLPDDVPMALDDVVPFAAMLAGTRKPFIITPRDGTVVPKLVEMAALCGEANSFVVYSMPAPPLRHDFVAVDKLVVCARLGVPVVYGPAPHLGVSAPSSVAAVTVVGNAEALSGLVINQIAKPGAPFIYGAYVYGLSMRTSSEVYCSPEAFAGQFAQCDLARFYGLPSFGYGGITDSKMLDEQWGAESALTVILSALSRATLIHDVGYMEAGMQGSFEAIVLGEEFIGYARALLREVRVDDEALALDEIKAVGPGGNHLARAYTRKHHRRLFDPQLLDKQVYDRWLSAGAQTLRDRVHERALTLSREPRVFELEPQVRQRLFDMAATVGPDERTTLSAG
jgi:trimethylamine--corrinoid protein Co-methyltransferase